MTAEEFEKQYADRSGITVEALREWRIVLPCDCGDDSCQGWQSKSRRLHEADLLTSNHV